MTLKKKIVGDCEITGTLTLPAQVKNTFFAGPSSGSNATPAFRTITAADITSFVDAGNSSTALTLNFATAATQKVTLTGNCTFTFSNPVAGGVYVLHLHQDATGSRTVTWPAAVTWAGGTAPTLTTTASKTDIVTFTYDGTSYYGVVSGQNY